MPEGGWNPKATLDQVTDAKHPNEALEKRFFPSETTNSEKGKAKTSIEVLKFLALSSLKPTLQIPCKMHPHLQTQDQPFFTDSPVK